MLTLAYDYLLTIMTEFKCGYKLDLEGVPIAAEADCC